MGIETLQNAAHAAGFAMVTDEPATDAAPQAEEVRRVGAPALLLQDQSVEKAVEKAQASFGEWVKTVIGASGRAPA